MSDSLASNPVIANNVLLKVLNADQPSRYGAELHIQYATVKSPFGPCFIAVSELGICYLGFPSCSQQLSLLNMLAREWPLALLLEDKDEINKLATSIFHPRENQPLTVLLKGTDFQLSVWQALLTIGQASLANYSDVACRIGKPKAVRAVGTAIGKNPVSYLIPCHRVVPKSGGVGKYLWGSECKEKILAAEKALWPV